MDERLVDKAVDIWKKLLAKPKYDALGDGPSSIEERTSMGLASTMAAMLPNNATPEILDKFGEELKKILMDENRNTYERTTMHVDYGPDRTLQEAAELAGLKMEFPWKTSVRIFTGEHGEIPHVTVAAGYGAASKRRYPLKNGKWLVTDLCGEDIKKIIKYVEGETLELEIEE